MSEKVNEVMVINLTGEIIKNRYCILEQIGSGGNGSVYLALDMELGCKWAVKVIEHWQKKEASVLKGMNHPFLPKMIDYEEDEKYCYLVMEYIEGENLEEYLGIGRKINRDEAWKLVLFIAEILAYFHRQKPAIIYGDLKPANLIRTERGEIYLVDFGSVVSGRRARPTVCQGTKGYAAPEQYDGKMTTASDVYAFGKTAMQIFKHVQGGLFGMWNLQWILLRCCQKQETYRYRDMNVVLSKLRKVKVPKRRAGEIVRTIGIVIVLLILLMIGIAMGISEMMKRAEEQVLDFHEEVSKVTDFYWEDETFEQTGEYSNSCCEEVEKSLQKMLKGFSGKEEQRELLGLLALNAEYMEEYRNAAFYYEQLLMYDEDYAEGYGGYGLFLMRRGQGEESVRLYEKFMGIENRMGDLEKGYYFEAWEKEIKLWREENVEKSDKAIQEKANEIEE